MKAVFRTKTRENLIRLSGVLVEQFNIALLNSDYPYLVNIEGKAQIGKSLIIEAMMRKILDDKNELEVIGKEENKHFLEDEPSAAGEKPHSILGQHKGQPIFLAFDNKLAQLQPDMKKFITDYCKKASLNAKSIYFIISNITDGSDVPPAVWQNYINNYKIYPPSLNIRIEPYDARQGLIDPFNSPPRWSRKITLECLEDGIFDHDLSKNRDYSFLSSLRL